MAAETSTLQHYLVKRCKQNDRQAQNELYKLYVGAMYNVCRRMLTDEEEARDALQEGFIEAFMNLHTLHDERTFAAWLKRIVINRCLNMLRKKQLDLQPLTAQTQVAEEDSHEQAEYVQWEVQRILQALPLLPEGGRVVLTLYLFEGYDHKEISEILQISETTSKTQYSRARKKLREILTQKNHKLTP